MIRIGYYPGCSLPGTAREYDESVRALAPAIGIELVEVPDWNCCGATAAHNLNHELALALPARILAIAEREGLDQILVPCAACFSRLAGTRKELLNDNELKDRISKAIDMDYTGKAIPVNILDVLSGISAGDISSKVTNPFNFATASYYGCLLSRPRDLVGIDRHEDPLVMEGILEAAGARPLDWAFKVECCGAGFSVSRTDIVGRLSAKIINDAVNRGAEAIIVACPMCHSNLDMRRPAIEKAANRKFEIPVLYITQAIGLALGLDFKKLGLHRHLVKVNLKPDPIVRAAGEGAPALEVEV